MWEINNYKYSAKINKNFVSYKKLVNTCRSKRIALFKLFGY